MHKKKGERERKNAGMREGRKGKRERAGTNAKKKQEGLSNRKEATNAAA